MRKAKTGFTDDSEPPFPQYAERPVDFFREILGVEPWSTDIPGASGQIDIIRAFEAGHKSVSVRSGHKVGKSTTDAGLAIWWYCTRPFARAIMTAPTYRQIAIVLWREVRRLWRVAQRRALARGVELREEPSRDPDNGLSSDDGREILGFSTNDPDRFSGISGANVLYIADEASGIDEGIFEAIEGNRAGGAWLILTGNPTKTSGKFYDSFHRERGVFHCLHISSRNTPKLEHAIPGLATAAWVAEREQVWGSDSATFQVRCEGNFPTQASNAVVPLWLLEQSLQAWSTAKFDGPLQIGVDPARYGDDESVIQPRRGYRTVVPTVLRNKDSVELANEVLKVVRDLRTGLDERAIVNIDTIGIGAGVFDVLKRHEKEVIAVSCDSSRKADNDEFSNLRAQLHFGLRDWMKEGGGVHPDAILEGELVAPTYTFDSQNRFKVESKDDIKERIHHSPDRMDALQLAVYRSVHCDDYTVLSRGGRYSSQPSRHGYASRH